jgi:hypothetical protein
VLIHKVPRYHVGQVLQVRDGGWLELERFDAIDQVGTYVLAACRPAARFRPAPPGATIRPDEGCARAHPERLISLTDVVRNDVRITGLEHDELPWGRTVPAADDDRALHATTLPPARDLLMRCAAVEPGAGFAKATDCAR